MASQASAPAGTATVPLVKRAADRRLNLIVPQSTYAEISELSQDTRHSISELVRLGLALVRLALREARNGNRLVIKTASGEEKEVLLPS